MREFVIIKEKAPPTPRFQSRERVKRKMPLPRAEATRDVIDYLKMFCNSKHRHGSNDGVSPVEFGWR